MSRKTTGSFITAAAIALFVGAPALVQAQSAEEQPQGHEHMHGQMQSSDVGSSSCCQQMAAKKKEMMADQQQIQAELDELLVLVQSTTGHAQQAAMADLLTMLVEQRGRKGGMMKMHPELMKNMGSSDMANCPMMKNMQGEKSTDEPSADAEDHSQHH